MAKRKTKEEFIKEAVVIHEGKYDYSKVKYVNNITKVCIICPEHGEFWQTPSSHLQGCGCQACSKVKIPTNEEFIQKANIKHDFKYQYLSQYKNCREKLLIMCPKHGQFTQLPSAHLKGAGCPLCAREQNAINLRLTSKEFIKKAKIIHKNYYNYSLVTYVDELTPVKIICPVHGVFEQKPVNHLAGCGCKKCKLKSQTKVYNRLKEVFPKLKFIFEATSKHIPWAGKYRFDIYNEKYNFIIEYDGELHFISKEIFGGEEKLKLRQSRDKEKDLLCLQNGCKLFRLKYNYTEEDFNNLINNINLILNQY